MAKLFFLIILLGCSSSSTLCSQDMQRVQPPAALSKEPQEANIYLNFDGVSLASVVNYIGEQRKINLIPSKDANLENAKVTLSTRTPLTFDRAWDAMLTLLEMNSFSMIKVGDAYRIVSSPNNGQEPLPIYTSTSGTQPEDLPDNDMVIRYAYFLKNIKTDTAHTILAKMTDEKNLVEQKDLNVVIIKDKSINIKSAFKIIKALDMGGLSENIQIVPLTWANSDTVQKLFSDVLGSSGDDRVIRFAPTNKEGMQYFSSNTRIFSEPIKNSLILLGTQKNLDKIKDFVSKYIDVPIDDAESRLHVKEIRYLVATDVKTILDDLVKPAASSGGSKGSLVVEGGFKNFEDVIISAEAADDGSSGTSKRGTGNRIIVACNRDDWRRLEEFVDTIDKPQPQVAIEVMVVDVTNSQAKGLGAQMFNIRGKPVAHNVNANFANLSNSTADTNSSDPYEKQFFTPPSGQLLQNIGNDLQTQASWMTLGNAANNNLWAIIQAQFNISNSQIVSQPYVVTNNHQPCEVTVKNTQVVPGGLDLTKSLTPVQKQQTIEASTSIKLTPHINLVGLIDLEIVVDISQFVPNTDQGGAPTITKRGLTTKSTMATGEVLALGGLTVSDLTEGIWKTPILGDIPFIGSLFKYKTKNKTETNLYIFLRPSIIKPRFEGAPDEYTQLKLDYAKYQLMKNDLYVHDTDPIQRWFFKPTNHTIKEKLDDAARGILRPVDDFAYGKNRPKSVAITDDPYFASSETRKKAEAVIARSKLRSRSDRTPEPEPIRMDDNIQG